MTQHHTDDTRTLRLGFDPAATPTIDEAFGERALWRAALWICSKVPG